MPPPNHRCFASDLLLQEAELNQQTAPFCAHVTSTAVFPLLPPKWSLGPAGSHPQSPAPTMASPLPRSPALLALQQLAVGGNLHIQGQLGVHQVLVVTQQPGQVFTGSLQSLFQIIQLALGVFEGILSPLLSICNGVLYVLTLGEKETRFLLAQEVQPVLAEEERGSISLPGI